jgi:predicted nuclease of predicted toxin-antitoxin system
MFPPLLASELRARGYDVVAVTERDDLRSQTDPVIFGAGQRESRTIVTEDRRGFRTLARAALLSGATHFGLILTSPRRFARHNERTFGQLLSALEDLLRRDVNLEGTEHWLRPPEP